MGELELTAVVVVILSLLTVFLVFVLKKVLTTFFRAICGLLLIGGQTFFNVSGLREL